ncbi:MAG: AtpZ/AtpI family protein [Polyangiaceae bacterium]|nr:AtpZ/AtpI family protein [Polyangiaceae bacterium]
MKQNWKGLGTYGTVGLELALSVLFGLFVGSWLDRKLGTHWIALVGFGFGLAAGVRSLWRALVQANRDADRMDQEEKNARKKFDGDDPDAD